MDPQRLFQTILLSAVVLAITAVVPAAFADSVQPTPSLPPTNGAYTAGNICGIPLGPGICLVNARIFDFTDTTRSFPPEGEAIDSNVTQMADVYTDVGGSPGMFLGPLTLMGGIGILYAGRTDDSELGDFVSTLTELDLTGSFNQHSIEVVLGAMPSTGLTGVDAFGREFLVSGFFDVFVDVSIDHGPFVAGPERMFILTPEPGSFSLLALGIVGAASEIRRRIRAGSR